MRRLLPVFALATMGSLCTAMPSAAGQTATITFAGAGDVSPRIGTGSIQGRVIATDTGSPLRRAQVSLGGVSPGSTPPVVLTDEQGRFAFNKLPTGRYTVTATKSGYASLGLGQRRPGQAGRTIDLANGQTITGADFNLPRGAVILVRVTDELGEPMPNVSVSPMQRRFVSGERRLIGAGSGGTTDAAGERRLSGLLPGTYYVSAGTSSLVGSDAIAAGNGQAYLRTYYLGTTFEADAQPVTVELGAEVNVSIVLSRGRVARISGVVRTSDDRPPTAVTMSLSGGTATSSFSMGLTPRLDGSFSLAGVFPGDYTIVVTPQVTRVTVPNATQEYASVPVKVTGDDLTVAVRTSAGGSAHGRFVFDTGAPPAGVRPGSLAITTSNVVRFTFSTGRATSSTTDWTFDIAGLTSETLIALRSSDFDYGSTAVPAATGWYLKAVLLDGRDVTDTPIDFSGDREVSNLQVVVTQKRTTVSGGAVDAQNTPVEDYVAVIFPEDRTRWTSNSRFISAARPDQQGRFVVNGLPPGRYLAVALDYLPTGEERDPDLLNRIQGSATPMVLEEGEKKEIRLKTANY